MILFFINVRRKLNLIEIICILWSSIMNGLYTHYEVLYGLRHVPTMLNASSLIICVFRLLIILLYYCGLFRSLSHVNISIYNQITHNHFQVMGSKTF